MKASDVKRRVCFVKAMVRSSRSIIGADAPTSWQAGSDPIKRMSQPDGSCVALPKLDESEPRSVKDRVASSCRPDWCGRVQLVGGEARLFILRPRWPCWQCPGCLRPRDRPGKGVASDRIEPGRPLSSGGGSRWGRQSLESGARLGASGGAP